jgi:glycine/D-amino acid oxidase-like deaminating enzyme
MIVILGATMNRQEIIRHYQAHPQVPVLIVGGGVNGIATFRDLALQGVSVLLVEQNDFASGASAASSHMVHGGIRYLENGEFRLVNEALHERNRLLFERPPLRQTLAHHHSAGCSSGSPASSTLPSSFWVGAKNHRNAGSSSSSWG